MKDVWPDTFVEESNLTSNISVLRKHLGASPDGGEYIETIPKRGYRFAAFVTSSEPQDEQPSVNVGRAQKSRRGAVFAGVATIAVIALFYIVRFRSKIPGEGLQVISLAVLPVENLSGDPAQEYFSDAITEALTTNLAQINSLSVISRNSAMQFKGTKEPLRNISEKLLVDVFVRGSVMRSGQRVKITVGLIRSSTDRYMWSKTYDDDMNDILSLQTQVARDIAHEISAKMTPFERERLARTDSVNPEAYEAYSKGRFFWNQLPENSLLKSIQYLSKPKR
jgi:TolB-like protein